VDEAQVAGRLDLIDELFSENFVDHTPMEGLPGTREGVRMLFCGAAGGVSGSEDRHQRADRGGRSGGYAKDIPRNARRTVSRDFRNGSSVRFEVIDILTIRDRKVCEHRVVLDKLSLLQQLGAIPGSGFFSRCSRP